MRPFPDERLDVAREDAGPDSVPGAPGQAQRAPSSGEPHCSRKRLKLKPSPITDPKIEGGALGPVRGLPGTPGGSAPWKVLAQTCKTSTARLPQGHTTLSTVTLLNFTSLSLGALISAPGLPAS